MTFSFDRLNLGIRIPFFGNPKSAAGGVPGVKLFEDTTGTALLTGVKAVTAAGTPERLVGGTSPVLVDKVILFARKNKTTVNAGAIYLGNSAEAADNNIVLLAGERLELKAENGKKINLRDIYVDSATSADAVSFVAFQ